MTYRQIELPDHAIRYLVVMLRAERHALAQEPLSAADLQTFAHFDSLSAIEDAIPAEFWNE